MEQEAPSQSSNPIGVRNTSILKKCILIYVAAINDQPYLLHLLFCVMVYKTLIVNFYSLSLVTTQINIIKY